MILVIIILMFLAVVVSHYNANTNNSLASMYALQRWIVDYEHPPISVCLGEGVEESVLQSRAYSILHSIAYQLILGSRDVQLLALQETLIVAVVVVLGGGAEGQVVVVVVVAVVVVVVVAVVVVVVVVVAIVVVVAVVIAL